jgi:SAM-dependent methyltransferase
VVDQRAQLYRSLHKGHMADEDARIHSAHTILSLLQERATLDSVLDVGCGRGIWLAVAAEMGARRKVGIEGPWLEQEDIYCDRAWIVTKDLEQGVDLAERFDLVISLEVGEHLPHRFSQTFIRSLTRHGDLILFSAAIPHQGGFGHVNEQFLDYWASLFEKEQFLPLDFIRRRIWRDNSVITWFRQNVIVFAHKSYITNHKWAADAFDANGPLAIVHPHMYMHIIERTAKTQKSLASSPPA